MQPVVAMLNHGHRGCEDAWVGRRRVTAVCQVPTVPVALAAWSSWLEFPWAVGHASFSRGEQRDFWDGRGRRPPRL